MRIKTPGLVVGDDVPWEVAWAGAMCPFCSHTGFHINQRKGEAQVICLNCSRLVVELEVGDEVTPTQGNRITGCRRIRVNRKKEAV